MTDQEEQKQQDFTAAGNIADSIATDFSNWLGIISGYAISITDNLIPNTRAHEDAIKILDATRHAEALIKRLKSISKAARDISEDDMKLMNVAHAIEEAISLAEEALDEKEIKIRYKESPFPLFIMAEYSQFIDCLMHIFFNSIEAMPNGGTITVDTSATKVNDKISVLIRIRDSGEGISKEVVNNIFDPFFSTRKNRNPIGLGLTVARSFIEQWGGAIKVRSQQGRGSSFRIILPQAEKGKSSSRKSIKAGMETTILAIDNSQEELDRLKHILSIAGLKVRTFTSGTSAVEYYAKNSKKISMVLIDLVMPGKDGKIVMSDIRAINPQASIVIMSGFSRDYIRHYLNAKDWKFIQKPVESNLLTSTVKDVIKANKEKLLNNPDFKK